MVNSVISLVVKDVGAQRQRFIQYPKVWFYNGSCMFLPHDTILILHKNRIWCKMTKVEQRTKYNDIVGFFFIDKPNTKGKGQFCHSVCNK